MCNRTDCAGSWAGEIACRVCEEGSMAMHTVITIGRLEALERAEKENAALREQINRWQWYEEVRDYDPWREHPYCTACGLASHLCKDQGSLRVKRKLCLENAIAEWESILSAAEVEAKNES